MLFFLLRGQFIFFILTSIISLTSIAQDGLYPEELDINKSFIEAVMQDDVQAVQRLLGQGADVDAQNQFSHYTALMTAIHRNHGEIVQILLDAGADFNFQTESGITPLMVASRDVIPGRDIIVAELLERGADLNVRNGDGDRAINIAVESHNLNVRDFALTDPEQILVMFHSIPGKWRAQLDVIQLLVSTRLKNE